MRKVIFILSLVALLTLKLSAQNSIKSVPFDDKYWDFGESNYSIHEFMGKESIEISDGSIAVKDVAFLNGTIQVDINFPADFSFPGVFFRRLDPGNLESFYVRPHLSGKPDAVQYTPVFNGLAGWQLYFGEGFWQTVDLIPNTWHTIKINFLNDQADVYFDDMEVPILKITELKRALAKGEIGVNAGPPVHFANFKYSTANPVLVDRDPKEKVARAKGLITNWKISDILTDSLYQNKIELNTDGLKWDTYQTEESGIINIAKYRTVTDTENTVFAKLVIKADQAIIKELKFGYNDFTWVYVNGQITYAGRNDYRSRDYRFLGSVGLFDSVYLPLKKGDNEIIFVVSELFGGWGLKAQLTDLEGIRIR